MTDDDNAIRLVVNADGYGSSTAASRAILRAHQEGIVTSTSVIGNCPDPIAIKNELAAAPNLGVGVQLTLVGGQPVSSPGAVRSLVDASGAFPGRTDLVLGWAKGALRQDDVEREFDLQVSRLREAGLVIDHLNTYLHTGFLPTVGRAVEAVARRHRIEGVRLAVERPNLAWVAELPRAMMAAALGGLAWVTRRQIGPLRHGPQTWGYVESGHLDEIRILEIIGRLGPGRHELICHPVLEDGQAGAGDPARSDGARELRALTSAVVREALARRRVTLCRWSDLF